MLSLKTFTTIGLTTKQSPSSNKKLPIARAIKKCSKWLVYYGATGDNLAQIGEEENLQVAHEVHLEKIYDKDGNIDFSARDLENTNISIPKIAKMLTEGTNKGIIKVEEILNNNIDSKIEKLAEELLELLEFQIKSWKSYL